ncbi:atlastin-1-like [Paramacrobiotus metropolitanus]|uniref:atlastin-1-like n=1 Tax=Paramacrobiotus metropolitanus TaxID=2943436 RepID=UPI0024457CE8|nr:atlastin-1-like [Paramacrobiotus metropolitanus]XP_055350861.1 atlastin-1-like [Paramacrobiotus metropolitanus]XP_055350862.1 atlastin-1-like [Paramacrobiotus metropolitanus]
MEESKFLIQLAKRSPSDQLEIHDMKKFAHRLRQDDIRDHFICTVGIVGKLREGKSTMLNIMHRYLEQVANDNWGPEAMAYLYETAIDHAPFITSKSSSGCTQGIWITKDPYVLSHISVGPCAVFLLDTQGLLDNDSRPELDSSLFLLTSMISLFTIFNVHRGIGKDHVRLLAEFSHIATKIHTTVYDGTSSVFQHLVVLTRDTLIGVNEYQYGWADGDKYLNNKIRTPHNLELLRAIEKVFIKLACFLAPKIANDPDDEAFRLSADFVLPEFRDNINTFLEYLFGPLLQPFQRKSIPMTCQMFADFIEHLAEIFDNGSIPTAESMLELMIRCELQDAVSTAFGRYHENISAIIVEAIDEDHLIECHKYHKEECKAEIQRTVPILQQDPIRSAPYLEKLDTDIDRLFALVRDRNHTSLLEWKKHEAQRLRLCTQLDNLALLKDVADQKIQQLQTQMDNLALSGERERMSLEDYMTALQIQRDEKDAESRARLQDAIQAVEKLKNDLAKE